MKIERISEFFRIVSVASRQITLFIAFPGAVCANASTPSAVLFSFRCISSLQCVCITVGKQGVIRQTTAVLSCSLQGAVELKSSDFLYALFKGPDWLLWI